MKDPVVAKQTSPPSETLHDRLYRQLRADVLEGRLPPGHRVPSTRALSEERGISRTTVTNVFDQLIAEGYFETRRGSGTFVAAGIQISPAPQSDIDIPLSRYAQRMGERPIIRAEHPKPGTINFVSWRPEIGHFPTATWARFMAREARHATLKDYDYAPNSLGWPPLREAIARYLVRSRSVRCDASQIVVTNGSQQAIDLCVRLLLNPGDTAAFEDPGYLGARQILQSHGVKLKPIPVDEEGIQTSKLKRAKLVYVTPSHQFPTGAALSLKRRLELIQWAERNHAVILEDDYDREYRFGGRPIPALQGLAESVPVIYVGTFSKVMFPGVRIGYVVAPPSMIPALERAKWLADRQCPAIEQKVLTRFLTEGLLERHIRRMRSLYDKRRATLETALDASFGDRVKILGDRAGMHLAIELGTNQSEDVTYQNMLDAGVMMTSASPYYLGKPPSRPRYLLGYACLTERQIRDGVRRLASCYHF